ncbi:concanavalin A-like lectin/glucanase [Heliocybe sulcata]|uniref:Concanavalin A-like lectin/glucanase n=1 Tax=Heliocybe sulcata TaxID=5364 RepID=A0A5C3MSF1_9AGAM|nr:concanavalin A-like lectin/glucanase [Heliocybe sulcata]
MSYSRRPQYSATRRQSSDDDHLPHSSSPLSPPRPFFLGNSRADRGSGGSWSDAASTDPGSDSDRDVATTISTSNGANNAGVGARRVSNPRRQSWNLSDSPQPGQQKPRNHHRRRSSAAAGGPAATNVQTSYPSDDLASPTSADPFKTPNAPTPSPPGASADFNPATLYTREHRESYPPQAPGKAPPSSYPFPFQSHPGNPDPGTTIPGTSRRSSMESIKSPVGGNGYQTLSTRANSQGEMDLHRPFAPFMGEGGGSPRASGIYRNGNMSAGHLSDGGSPNGAIPRTSSVTTFRAPFLAPSSRPTSSLWTPPAYVAAAGNGSVVSLPTLPMKARPVMPSSRLERKLTREEKPWMGKKDGWARASWWLTIIGIIIGLGAAGVICWRGYAGVQVLNDSQLCIVLDDEFDSLDTSNTWNYDVELGGFGNGEFQMTTDSSTNIYTQNGELYIMPTLSTDAGIDIFNGGSYQLSDCTSDNSSACTANGDSGSYSVINPVQSARINTKGKYSIQYGKVEIRAKLPTGDWLWPALWMLPEDDTYGSWPLSGEIDIMEARGNSLNYGAQGVNFARSSLNYGPLASLQEKIFGWQSNKRQGFNAGFHTYSLEWDENFMRFYMDNRIHTLLDLKIDSKNSFWNRGHFPATAMNNSASPVVVQNPWQNSGPNAPFDQSFYLIIDLAAGGTSGWFPDNVGDKPWYDASSTAMYNFAQAQDTWSATWPSSADDRAFRIDYVKMWKKC